MEIKFYGTRGSIPVPGKKTIKFGGNTPCLRLTSDSGFSIILDAGTGIRELGEELMKSEEGKIFIFLTHTHWDHIQGLPFFRPLYEKKNLSVTIYSNNGQNTGAENVIEAQLNSRFFPVDSQAVQAKLAFKRMDAGKRYSIGDFEIKTIEAHHSAGTLALKISNNGRSVVYMTDNEVYYNNDSEPNLDDVMAMNSELVQFCRGCDYLIHDSMYNLKDFETKIGWGHSNNLSTALLAVASGVKNLVLFHYDPTYDDNKILKILSDTGKMLKKYPDPPRCSAAKEKTKIKL